MTSVTVEAALRQGLEHYNASRLPEAEALFRQALAAVPEHTDGLNMLGLIALRTGHVSDAVTLIGRAVTLAPRIAEYQNNLGQALCAAGRFNEAISCYRRAIELNDGLATAHLNLGNLLWERRLLSDSEAHLRRAAEIHPDDPAAFVNLAEVLRAQGKYDRAAYACHRAIQLDPGLGLAYCNLGKVMQATNRMAEAIELMQKAVQLQPDHAGVVGTLANAVQAAGRPSDATRIYHRALALDPANAVIRFNLAGALRLQGRVDDAVAAYRDAIARQPDNAAGHSSLLLTLHCSTSVTPRELFDEHLKWAARHAEPLWTSTGAARAGDGKVGVGEVGPRGRAAEDFTAINRRVRVGFVSPDLHVHPVGFFVEPALRINPDRFEVFVYADELRSDAVTERLRSLVGIQRWRNVVPLSDADLAEQVRADEIDILLDLAGHTADNRLLTFARKPAPVQATWLGYPNTTGMSAMDFRLTDAQADPVGLTDSLHTERLLRLAVCSWCYAPPDRIAPVPRRRDDGPITFGTFNGLQKLSPPAIEAWSRVLHRSAGSRLLLKSPGLEDPENRKRLVEAFTGHGISPDRVELSGTVADIVQHLSTYQRIDVALDTFPYNGTTTTCEALWMGVPVIALAGRTHASRVGVSLLRAAGLGDLVAETLEQYVDLAVAMAADSARRSELRRTLRDRIAGSALTDATRFSADFGDALEAMWASSPVHP